jgi:hypothetical protein
MMQYPTQFVQPHLMPQRQISNGRGGQIVGKNMQGAIRTGQIGGRGMIQMQPGQQQQNVQSFQDFPGINIGPTGMMGQQPQLNGMMGRGMGMGMGPGRGR